VPGICLDTSALGRVVLGEADAPAIRARLAQFDPWRSSELLVVESRRLGKREGVSPAVEAMLALVTLTALPRTLLEEASLIDSAPDNFGQLEGPALSEVVGDWC
jgi:uncharacterized protein with PIN domain